MGGDALDIHADKDYIGKDIQVVSVLTPGSAVRRIVKSDGTIEGMRRRRGMITRVKKKQDYLPWQRPWKDEATAPFKVRYLRQDPRGIALSLAHDKKVELGRAES